MEQENLITLTAEIVAAHLSNNNVAIGDLPILMQNVHESLTRLTATAPDEPVQAKTAAVTIRASLKPEYLVCLECGRKQKTLRRHLGAAHGLTPEQYRADYGLPKTYPMVAANYARQRSEMALSIGLGSKTGRKNRPESKPPQKKRAAKPG